MIAIPINSRGQDFFPNWIKYPYARDRKSYSVHTGSGEAAWFGSFRDLSHLKVWSRWAKRRAGSAGALFASEGEAGECAIWDSPSRTVEGISLFNGTGAN